MENLKFKYLRVNEITPFKDHQTGGRIIGPTVCRIDVSHLNKKGRIAEWDRLDTKYPVKKYTSCYEEVSVELPCFEYDPVNINEPYSNEKSN